MGLTVQLEPDEIWTDIKDNKIFIRDMDENHAKNALRMMIRKFRADREYGNRHSWEAEKEMDQIYWDIMAEDAGDR